MLYQHDTCQHVRMASKHVAKRAWGASMALSLSFAPTPDQSLPQPLNAPLGVLYTVGLEVARGSTHCRQKVGMCNKVHAPPPGSCMLYALRTLRHARVPSASQPHRPPLGNVPSMAGPRTASRHVAHARRARASAASTRHPDGPACCAASSAQARGAHAGAQQGATELQTPAKAPDMSTLSCSTRYSARSCPTVRAVCGQTGGSLPSEAVNLSSSAIRRQPVVP